MPTCSPKQSAAAYFMRELTLLPRRPIRYRALRILQPSPEPPSHKNVALSRTMAEVSTADNCHIVTAKAVSPTAPRWCGLRDVGAPAAYAIRRGSPDVRERTKPEWTGA